MKFLVFFCVNFFLGVDSIIAIDTLTSFPVENIQTNGDCELRGDIRDNREIVDNNKAQGLSGEDIEVLRR